MRVERGLLPPSATIEVAAIAAAVERWETARDRAQTADRQYSELQRGNGQAQAEARDAEQLAGSIERGEPAPEPRFAQEFEAALATAKREALARVLVERASWEGVALAFREHGDELAEKAAKSFEQARARYLRAVKAVQTAHSALESAKGMKVFTAAGDGVYRPGAFLDVSEVPLPPPDADSGGTRVAAVLTALELCGSDRPLRPITNPDMLRTDLPPEQRHTLPWAQGRVRQLVPPGFEVTTP